MSDITAILIAIAIVAVITFFIAVLIARRNDRRRLAGGYWWGRTHVDFQIRVYKWDHTSADAVDIYRTLAWKCTEKFYAPSEHSALLKAKELLK